MADLFLNLRYGARVLLRKPTFTLIVVVTLALGIGANGAIFSFVDAILLHPLPFPDPERLVMVWVKLPQAGDRNQASPADFVDWTNQSQAFANLVAYRLMAVNLTGEGEPERILASRVSPQFFEALGAKFAVGRAFSAKEEKEGNDRVLVLSHSLWQRDFGGRLDITRTTVDLDGRSCTVVGVLAPGFEWPTASEIWTPLALKDEREQRQIHSLYVMGRIKPDSSLPQARADMQVVTDKLARQYPLTNANESVALVRLPGQYSDDIMNAFLFVLMGAVAFVLLISGSNVANLLLADAISRQREMAVRTVLGASRRHIVVQGLIESTLLAILGGILGLFCAGWGVDLIRASIPLDQIRYIPGWRQMHLTGRVVGFTFLITVLTGILSGLAPFLQTSKPDLNTALRQGGRSATAGFGASKFRNLLVATEFALALMLLVGTGLLIKGFSHMSDVHNQGFDAQNVLTMRMRLPGSEQQDTHRMVDFYRQVLERVQGLRGVTDAGVVSDLPMTGDLDTQVFNIAERPTRPTEVLRATVLSADGNYFRVMHIPVLAGRIFTNQDSEATTPVAILSESAARKFWASSDPIRTHIQFEAAPGSKSSFSVVGIVSDVKQFPLDEAPQPAIYLLYSQSSEFPLSLVVRTAGNPLAAVQGVHDQILQVNRGASLYEIKSMEQVIHDMTAGFRIATGLIAICGVVAMILAAAGVYGTVAHVVSLGRREMGIRMALGAQRREVVRLFVTRALKLTALGLGVGLPLAFALSRVMSSTLFGVVALDPYTFVTFTLVLAMVALLAAYVPASKATKIDPTTVLRYE
jgi:putative ABC transport system permease protein